ncbi:dioxygenase [Clostridium sp. SHJSY1]|uniref:DODA-type extradiol aromatic ring-opening family dioxygenase n=1 Tax=Clostridium sp. SHJSY1 TaxID=2942483 RepID=UPI00287418D8|nr:class III extradiol ring-cleavage dioxygenase [Clostridium sp. SHJSY1]MDS0525625.1 dioxygenase [Clostridium sp. SHJSY1]
MIKPLFLAHGSPMMAIEENGYTKFLNELGTKLAPKAVIVFTSHWDTDTLTISSSDATYNTMYDFYGFPKELYEIKYNAKGSDEIASKILDRLKAQGIQVKKDTTRGLDHGAWTLLMHVFPNADLPIIQVSVNSKLSPKEQIKIGTALKSFANEDILIIGSGNTVHNLRLVNYETDTIDSWAKEFDDWIITKLNSMDFDTLDNYKSLAPHANLAVPSPDHFIPLFIALGSSPDPNPKTIFRGYQLGNLSYLCFEF